MPLAQTNPVISVLAGASALTMGKVVKMSSGAAVVSAAATDTVLGVVTEDASAATQVAVAVDGIVFAEAAASGIAIGDPVAPAASGQVNKTTTATHKLFGVALEASTAAGQLIKIQLGAPHFIIPA